MLDLVDDISRWESGELDSDEEEALFGCYGRRAAQLIEEGRINR